MIAVYTLDGTELKLNYGSAFTINWVSTVFNDSDEFLGSKSFPVDLADCPSNNKALNMGIRLENRSARVDTPVMVRIFGIHWKKCALSFTIGTNGYSAFLKIDNGTFGNLIKNTQLPDIFTNRTTLGAFQSFKTIKLSYSVGDTLTYLANSCAAPGKYPAYFFPLYNKTMFGGSSVDSPAYDSSLQTVNPWQSGVGFLPDEVTSPEQHFYTPFFTLHYVVKQVLSFLGYTPAGDFFADPLMQDKVIFNTGFIDHAAMFAPAGLELSLAKHLPALTLTEFFTKLRTSFKLAIYFDADTQTCTMNYGKNTITSRERVDISGYVEASTPIKSTPPAGYELINPVDDGDSLYKNFQYDKSYFIGDVSKVAPVAIDAFIGTTFARILANPLSAGVNYRIPRVDQVGNAYTDLANGSDAWNQTGFGKNAFNFRILTYRGMQEDSAGELYPYGTSDELNSLGADDHAYGLSCWLGGAKGLLAVYNFDWYTFFLRTELVELTAHLPMRLLQRVTPLGLIEFVTPTRAIIPAMMNDMTFEANKLTQKIQAKITAYPIYSQNDLALPALSQFKPSEEINPGGIYVRIAPVVPNESSTYADLGHGLPRIPLDLYADITLQFFSDEAGTIPREVSNLLIHLHTDHYYFHDNLWSSNGYYITASGSEFVIGNDQLHDPFDQIYHRFSSGGYWKHFYSLSINPVLLAGLDYKLCIPNGNRDPYSDPAY